MLTLKTGKYNSRVLITPPMVILSIILMAMAASVINAQDCQPRASSGFTFVPQFLGDSMTVSINLSPCETVTLTETHDMGGDANRGTNVKMTYSNGSGQVLHSEQFTGFLTGAYSFPSVTPWPLPWRGTVSCELESCDPQSGEYRSLRERQF